MKTKKKPGEKARAFSSGLFLLFSPDAQHPVGGASHRPARGRAPVAHPARKETIFLCKGVSAWPAVRAPNSQKCNLPLQREFCVAAVPQPARKTTILISEGVSAWRLCRSQFAKFHSFFCKGVSACSCGAPNSQKHIRSLQKFVCMLLCFTGTLLATYRLPVPENGCRDFCPCWGVGQSPAWFLTLHRETV